MDSIKNKYISHNQQETLHHVEEVADIAVRLAKVYDLDVEKVRIAALLHDISAVITPQQMYETAKKHGLQIDPAEEKYHALLHQRISKIIAQEDYEITDSDILHAVECHTTLKKNAGTFDKIIFIADKISRDANMISQYDNLLQNNSEDLLNEACYLFIKHQIDNGLLAYAHQWLLDAYKELQLKHDISTFCCNNKLLPAIKCWLHTFVKTLHDTFAERIWFVGLQGSHARNEATENSDIDVVVILDKLTVADIKTYNTILDTLPNRELICGFLSGKNELLNWEPSDLFQFYHDTKPIIGNLDVLLPLLDKGTINRAIKIGACNIYHGCVHNMLHEKSAEILKGLYKAASFVVQAIVFIEKEKYISRQKDLFAFVADEEQTIIETFLHLKNGGGVNFDAMSETLFRWSGKYISE